MDSKASDCEGVSVSEKGQIIESEAPIGAHSRQSTQIQNGVLKGASVEAETNGQIDALAIVKQKHNTDLDRIDGVERMVLIGGRKVDIEIMKSKETAQQERQRLLNNEIKAGNNDVKPELLALRASDGDAERMDDNVENELDPKIGDAVCANGARIKAVEKTDTLKHSKDMPAQEIDKERAQMYAKDAQRETNAVSANTAKSERLKMQSFPRDAPRRNQTEKLPPMTIQAPSTASSKSPTYEPTVASSTSPTKSPTSSPTKQCSHDAHITEHVQCNELHADACRDSSEEVSMVSTLEIQIIGANKGIASYELHARDDAENAEQSNEKLNVQDNKARDDGGNSAMKWILKVDALVQFDDDILVVQSGAKMVIIKAKDPSTLAVINADAEESGATTPLCGADAFNGRTCAVVNRVDVSSRGSASNNSATEQFKVDAENGKAFSTWNGDVRIELNQSDYASNVYQRGAIGNMKMNRTSAMTNSMTHGSGDKGPRATDSTKDELKFWSTQTKSFNMALALQTEMKGAKLDTICDEYLYLADNAPRCRTPRDMLETRNERTTVDSTPSPITAPTKLLTDEPNGVPTTTPTKSPHIKANMALNDALVDHGVLQLYIIDSNQHSAQEDITDGSNLPSHERGTLPTKSATESTLSPNIALTAEKRELMLKPTTMKHTQSEPLEMVGHTTPQSAADIDKAERSGVMDNARTGQDTDPHGQDITNIKTDAVYKAALFIIVALINYGDTKAEAARDPMARKMENASRDDARTRRDNGQGPRTGASWPSKVRACTAYAFAKSPIQARHQKRAACRAYE